MSSNEQPDSTANSLIRFFSKPVVGVTGSIASVVGIILAVYFFLAAREIRQLTYFVHPVKSIIVSAGQSSQLSVTFRDENIKANVTAAQVAFWNGGHQSIRPENILRPFVIKVGDHVPILEARIRKKSREVINLELDETKLQQGKLSVSWNILEHNDEGVIQLVFAGDPNTPITAEAVIEGQPAVEALAFPGTIRSPGEQYARAGQEHRILGWILLSVGVLILFSIMFHIYRRRSLRELRLSVWAMIVQPLFLVAMAIYFLLKAQIPGPPFGF